MNLKSIAVKGTVATLIGQALRFILQAGSMVLLVRMLEPNAFGLIAMVTAITGLALVISDFGLSMAYIQAKEVTEQERSNIFWLNVIIGLALFLVVFSSAGYIADFYREPVLEPVTRTMSFVFLISCVTAQHRAELSKQFEFNSLAACDVGAAAVGTLVAIILAYTGATYWALVWQQVVMAGCTSLFLLYAVRWRPLRPKNFSNLGRFVRYGFNTSLVQILNYVTANIDSILIGRRWGAADLGYYDRAYQLFKVPLNQIAAPMTRVAVPVLSRTENLVEFTTLLLNGRLIMLGTVGFVFLFVSANASDLVQVIFGDGWEESSSILSILTLGGFFQAMSYPYFWAFLSKSKTGLQLRFSVVTKLISIFLMIIGLRWGITGVAVGVTLGNVINWLILTLLAMPHLQLNRFTLMLSMVKPSLWISTPAIASHILHWFHPFDSSAKGIGASSAIYAVWILATMVVSKDVRANIASAIQYVRLRGQTPSQNQNQ